LRSNGGSGYTSHLYKVLKKGANDIEHEPLRQYILRYQKNDISDAEDTAPAVNGTTGFELSPARNYQSVDSGFILPGINIQLSILQKREVGLVDRVLFLRSRFLRPGLVNLERIIFL
jgi:hypothetical protein